MQKLQVKLLAVLDCKIVKHTRYTGTAVVLNGDQET